MKFEEIESLWTAQASVLPAVVDLADIKRRLAPEMRRRSRMLGYELVTSALLVLLLPVLAVANYRYDPVRYGAPWQWVHMTCQIAVAGLLLAHTLQRLSRHRALQRQSMNTLRGMTEVSVANLEAEMRDHRWRQPVFALGLASATTAVVAAGLQQGWTTGLFAGVGSAALAAVMALAFWRHYRVNLYPAWVRQRQLLRELE
jgi:hypothetical protein